MSKIVLIQSSLRKDSRTAVVIKHAAQILERKNIEYQIIDLRNYDMPFCDGRPRSEYAHEYPDVPKLYEIMQSADAYIIGYPVYLYTISGVLKNFLDILGGPTAGKYFGIIANAGGKNNYMSSNDLINFMLYDFNSTAIMPQVYSHKGDFEFRQSEWILTGMKPKQKVREMVDTLLTKITETERVLI